MIDFFAAMVIAATGLFAMALYYRATIKVRHSFLVDFDTAQNLSIAQIAEASIDYWISQLKKHKTEEQKAYCYNKAHQAHKEVAAYGAAKQPEPEAAKPLADNVFRFPS